MKKWFPLYMHAQMLVITLAVVVLTWLPSCASRDAAPRVGAAQSAAAQAPAPTAAALAPPAPAAETPQPLPAPLVPPAGLPAAAVPAAAAPQPAPAPPAAAPVPAASDEAPRPQLIRNGCFENGMQAWDPWLHATTYSNALSVVPATGLRGISTALRIENPDAMYLGAQQRVRVSSGTVYRLSATVRSLATADSAVLFGGRVAFFLPPQHEQQIVWMSEYNRWLDKALVITNTVSGTATIYAHMGYGATHSTGEFTNIKLERLE